MANTEQQREAVIRKLYETQCNAVGVILEAEKMKEALNNNGDDTKGLEMAMIPFAAYEMQQDRHASEMDKMRKHYKNIIVVILIVFGVIMTSFAGATVYLVNDFMDNVDNAINDFMNNYDVFSYEQDGDGFNNMLGKGAEQGDVNYEPKAEDN